VHEVVEREVTDAPSAGPATAGFADAQLPAVFELLSRVARAVVVTIGPDTEVVVHDLRDPEHSVVAISGALTGRQVGAPVPDPQLLPGEVGKFTDDDLRHRAITSAGRELLASTAWVRNAAGDIVGGICVNVDHSALRQARDLLDRHLGPGDIRERPLPTFASNVTDFAKLAIESVVGAGPPRQLRSAERLELIRRLDTAGVFGMRHAADAVAAELMVSRSSIYSDLRRVRWGHAHDGQPAVRSSRASGHTGRSNEAITHRSRIGKRRAGQVTD
jgi:predicted transcriptional regulator YheO